MKVLNVITKNMKSKEHNLYCHFEAEKFIVKYMGLKSKSVWLCSNEGEDKENKRHQIFITQDFVFAIEFFFTLSKIEGDHFFKGKAKIIDLLKDEYEPSKKLIKKYEEKKYHWFLHEYETYTDAYEGAKLILEGYKKL